MPENIPCFPKTIIEFIILSSDSVRWIKKKSLIKGYSNGQQKNVLNTIKAKWCCIEVSFNRISFVEHRIILIFQEKKKLDQRHGYSVLEIKADHIGQAKI